MTARENGNGFLEVLKRVGLFIIYLLFSILKGIWQFLMLLASGEEGWDDPFFPEDEKDKGLLSTKRSNVKLILSLSAVVINADGRIQDKELEYVEKRFVKDYNPRTAKLWMTVLSKELENEQDLPRLCRKVDYRFNRSTKIQLVHFLCAIATRDGMLTEKEFEVLKQIGMRVRLPFRTLQSVLALFDYITEEEAKNRQNDNKKDVQRPSSWLLDQAYSILEIEPKATDKQVKKAFRRLASIHHPDKVSHMGESFQLAANKKFRQLMDAYELIKKHRGMN